MTDEQRQAERDQQKEAQRERRDAMPEDTLMEERYAQQRAQQERRAAYDEEQRRVEREAQAAARRERHANFDDEQLCMQRDRCAAANRARRGVTPLYNALMLEKKSNAAHLLLHTMKRFDPKEQMRLACMLDPKDKEWVLNERNNIMAQAEDEKRAAGAEWRHVTKSWMSDYTQRRWAREQRQASQNQSDELDMRDYMTSNFYRRYEEECIGFLAKNFPQQFDLLGPGGRLEQVTHLSTLTIPGFFPKFVKKYNGHLAHAIPEIDELKEMRNSLLVFQCLEVEQLDVVADEAIEGVADATARGDGRDMAKWRLVADDLDRRLRKSSSFARDFWRCLAILSGVALRKEVVHEAGPLSLDGQGAGPDGQGETQAVL